MASLRPIAAALALLCAGCRQEMYNQPRYEPLERSTFFADERSARPLLYGVIARGELPVTGAAGTGREGGQFTDQLPFPATRDVLARGRERFDIFCSPCHGRLGDGNGMVVQRGFSAPPSFHSPRGRALPLGYIFSVVRNGYGAMPGYDDQIPVTDSWAIAAYVRVLQYSQSATLADVLPGVTPREREGMR